MVSAFFIFNAKGEVLISRLYKPDVKYESLLLDIVFLDSKFSLFL